MARKAVLAVVAALIALINWSATAHADPAPAPVPPGMVPGAPPSDGIPPVDGIPPITIDMHGDGDSTVFGDIENSVF